MNKYCLAIGALLLTATGMTLAADDDTEREVAHLIEFVAASGCDFNRNGSQHDSADAAEHLQLKYRRGKRWVDTAEQFIDRLASSSSLSKKPYTITCAGKDSTAASWLHAELASYRANTVSETVAPGTTGNGL
ncbi:hypothetical protein EYC98_00550 [Halieaceae bacterium IMCC14734]|uniref:DUF5329 domain-containing protein n=1 Tax=Candidatus Litorirhabdus singularis TaxID=2518993 RepID=A0ABT3TAM7_9GAMM|nr:DUF5329 domain-containing protein [Candidatus Litorirhabdus singularis]MCX2979348.1 hypothetical protein [Candidatus Litorirhabdus singularis]